MNDFHLYKMRHLFQGDEHIGKYDTATKSVRLRDEFAGLQAEVKAFMMRREGIFLASVLVGAEALAAVLPLLEFPQAIVDQMTAELGHRTPEVLEYARANFPESEFVRRYGAGVPYTSGGGSSPVEGSTDAPEAAAAPSKRKAKAPAEVSAE